MTYSFEMEYYTRHLFITTVCVGKAVENFVFGGSQLK